MPKNLLAWSCWNYSGKFRFSTENNISEKKNRLSGQLSTSLSVCPWKQRNWKECWTHTVRGTVVSSTECWTPSLPPVLAIPGSLQSSSSARGRQDLAQEWQCWPQAAKEGDEASAEVAWASRNTQCGSHLPTAKMIVCVPMGMCLSQRQLE